MYFMCVPFIIFNTWVSLPTICEMSTLSCLSTPSNSSCEIKVNTKYTYWIHRLIAETLLELQQTPNSQVSFFHFVRHGWGHNLGTCTCKLISFNYPLYHDDLLNIFRLKLKTFKSPFLTFGHGWHGWARSIKDPNHERGQLEAIWWLLRGMGLISLMAHIIPTMVTLLPAWIPTVTPNSLRVSWLDMRKPYVTRIWFLLF